MKLQLSEIMTASISELDDLGYGAGIRNRGR